MAAALACGPIDGSTGWLIYFATVWTCVATLLVKKACCETSDRTWRVFCLDSSKQLLGAAWSWILTDSMYECSAYLTSTMVETTLGVLVEYVLLVCLSRVFREATGNKRAFTSGEYYGAAGQFVWKNYMMQLALWLFCVTVMRSITVPVARSYVSDPHHNIAASLLEVVSWSSYLEMVFVVLIIPCAMRSLQVWLTDDFIKLEGAPGFFPLLLGKIFGRSGKVRRLTSSAITCRSSAASASAQPMLPGSIGGPEPLSLPFVSSHNALLPGGDAQTTALGACNNGSGDVAGSTVVAHTSMGGVASNPVAASVVAEPPPQPPPADPARRAGSPQATSPELGAAASTAASGASGILGAAPPVARAEEVAADAGSRQCSPCVSAVASAGPAATNVAGFASTAGACPSEVREEANAIDGTVAGFASTVAGFASTAGACPPEVREEANALDVDMHHSEKSASAGASDAPMRSLSQRSAPPPLLPDACFESSGSRCEHFALSPAVAFAFAEQESTGSFPEQEPIEATALEQYRQERRLVQSRSGAVPASAGEERQRRGSRTGELSSLFTSEDDEAKLRQERERRYVAWAAKQAEYDPVRVPSEDVVDYPPITPDQASAYRRSRGSPGGGGGT